MPNVDHARRELRLKLVYYGPGLGGKTSNLEHIHRATRADMRGKLITLNDAAERTLFFDLLPMELGQYRGYTVRVHLCTVPGQMANDRVRRLVLRHVDGIVMVVDSQHQRLAENLESIRNLENNLRLQGEDPATLPLVVQYNKRDLPTAAGVATLRQVLGVPREIPQLEAVAVEGQGVFETFKAILTSCLVQVGDPQRAPVGRSPSIVPGQRVSMFPDAEPTALGRERVPATAKVPRLPDEGD
jgi:signal recognition particle receptor subunit beta